MVLKKFNLVKLFLLVCLSFLVDCSSTETSSEDDSSCKSENVIEEVSQKEESLFDDDVIQIVNSMTIREKIGQTFLMSFRYWKDGPSSNEKYITKINDEIIKIIRAYHIGGVILFSENLSNTESFMKFISDMQLKALESKNLPLLMGIDQEGGIVTRLSQGTYFPEAARFGRSKDSHNAFICGSYIGEELFAAGFNCDFAPVCDVNSNPKNPIIGPRAYSSDALVVADFSSQMYLGLKSQNIIACGKHFPGHGDTYVDSHIGLPCVNKTRSEWESLELIPFKDNIALSIPMIMTAHIQYPKIDPGLIYAEKSRKNIYRPATLSSVILTDILRKELGFKGVICTDALEMKAISANFTECQAIMEALKAGADMLCNPVNIVCRNDVYKMEDIFLKVEKALAEGSLLEDRLTESVCRIVQLKKNYGILDKEYKMITGQDIDNAKKCFASKNHRAFAKQISTNY